MSTTTADPTFTNDLRPLHMRIADAIKDKDNQNAALAVVSAGAGATAGAAMGWVGYIVSIKFLESIAVPAYVLTLTNISGAIMVIAYSGWFAWTGWCMVRNRN